MKASPSCVAVQAWFQPSRAVRPRARTSAGGSMPGALRNSQFKRLVKVDLRGRVSREHNPALDHRSLASEVKDQVFARLEIDRDGLAGAERRVPPDRELCPDARLHRRDPLEDITALLVGLHGDRVLNVRRHPVHDPDRIKADPDVGDGLARLKKSTFDVAPALEHDLAGLLVRDRESPRHNRVSLAAMMV